MVTPYFTVRRLLRQDMAQVLALYRCAPRDGAWVFAQSPDILLAHASIWGGFWGDTLCICGGVCSLSAPLPLAAALCGTQLCLPQAVVLPLAASPQGLAFAPAFLAAFPLQKACALLPIKSGAPLAKHYFDAHYNLLAIRPLFELRPHYIFVQTQVKNPEKESIIVSLSETYSLAKLLEQGYLGTALCENGVVLQRME